MERLLRVVRREAETPEAEDEDERASRAGGVDDQVRELLVQLAAQEQAAVEAQPSVGTVLGWPAWSMDTGLTPAQERLVEHWSPQRVLDDARSVRQLVGALQRWRSTHGWDVELDEALSAFITLRAR